MKIVKINSTLIYLLPIFLVLSRFMADLTISICAILFLVSTFKNKEWHYFNNRFFILFLIFYLYILLRSFFTFNLISIESTVFYLRFGLFSLAVWHVASKNPRFIKLFFFISIILLLILSFDAIYQYYSGFNILGFPKFVGLNKVSSFFERKYILGSFICRIFPIIIGVYLYIFFSNKKSNLLNLVLILSIFIFLFVIFLSGERAALFLSFTAIFLIISFVKFRKKLKNIIFFLFLLFVTLTFISNQKIFERHIIQTYKQFTLNKTYKQLGFDTNFKSEYFIFSVHHHLHYLTAFKMFKDNILFGQGPKMFRAVCNQDKFKSEYIYANSYVINGCTSHPHNSYIQLLAETGVSGVVFLLLFFLYIVYKIFMSRFFLDKDVLNNVYNYRICLLICIFINFFPFIPTGNFFNNWLSIIYYLPIGLYLQVTDGKL